MRDLVGLILSGIGLFVGISLQKASAQRQLRAQLVAYRLTFPRGLEGDAVTRTLASFSGLLLPWWRRWRVAPFAVFEVHADATGIRHYLVIPESWSRVGLSALQAGIPSMRVEPVDVPDCQVRLAAEYRLSTHARPLTIDAAAHSATTLTALQPLASDERIVVQWSITPHAPVAPARLAGAEGLLPDRQPSDGEALAAMKKKHDSALFMAVGRIGVAAGSEGGAIRQLRRVEATWHTTRAPGVSLGRRGVSGAAVARRMAQRRVPLSAWPATLNVEELTGLVAWPVGSSAIPGLPLGSSRLVPPSPSVPSTGTVVADSNYPGEGRPLALSIEARLRHVAVLGPTGTGKSTLLVNMALSDLEAGHGLVLLDPKGDLVTDVLARMPEHRRRDVIVLDPADTDRPVGINPLRSASGASAEVVVENLVGLFKSLYRHSWGPRLDDILRAALLTLAGSEGTTLCEVSLILSDPSYRQRLVGRLDDPVGLESFWGWYEKLTDAERQTVVGPVLNKVRAFTMRPTVRGIIGQSAPLLDLGDVLANGKVLLCSLASGLLGEEAASLLGALIVAELWHATTARAGLAPERRRPVMAYLDEFQHFIHLPTPMSSMLAEARGLGLGLTLAHQHLDQLSDEAKHAVVANARSKIVFQLPAADARVIVRDMGATLTADDLQGLGAYEVACQLFAAGATQPPATGRTRPLDPTTTDGVAIRELSRARFGIDRATVESAIRQRQSGGRESGIGRRERPGRAS